MTVEEVPVSKDFPISEVKEKNDTFNIKKGCNEIGLESRNKENLTKETNKGQVLINETTFFMTDVSNVTF